MANTVMELIISRWGMASFHSDRHGSFLSNLMESLLKMFGIRQITNSTHASKATGGIEIVNKSIILRLRVCLQQEENVEVALPLVLFAMRGSISINNTGFSPYTLMTARMMKIPIDLNTSNLNIASLTAKEYFEELMPRLEIIRQVGKENILLAQQKYTNQYNKHFRVKDVPIQVGTKVLLKVMSLPTGVTRKVVACFHNDVYIVVQRLHPESSHSYIIQNMRTGKQWNSPVSRDKIKVFRERRQNFYIQRGVHPPEIKDFPDLTDSDTDEESEQVDKDNLRQKADAHGRLSQDDLKPTPEVTQPSDRTEDGNDDIEDLSDSTDHTDHKATTETNTDDGRIIRQDSKQEQSKGEPEQEQQQVQQRTSTEGTYSDKVQNSTKQ